jgi:hypothetical protein
VLNIFNDEEDAHGEGEQSDQADADLEAQALIELRLSHSVLSFWEAVPQVRSWFEKLTPSGPRQPFTLSLSRVDGGVSSSSYRENSDRCFKNTTWQNKSRCFVND